MGFNSLVFVFYVPKFTFSICYYINNVFFDQIHIDIFYHISYKLDYAELKRYDDLPKQTLAVSDPDHSARVILVQF